MMKIEKTHTLAGMLSELTVGDIRLWLDDDAIDDETRVTVAVDQGDQREPGTFRLGLHTEPTNLR